MNGRCAGFLLQLLTVHLITAQIRFPSDNYDLVSDLTAIGVGRTDAPRYERNQQNEQYLQYQQYVQNQQYQQNQQSSQNQPIRQNQQNHRVQQNQQSQQYRQQNQQNLQTQQPLQNQQNLQTQPLQNQQNRQNQQKQRNQQNQRNQLSQDEQNLANIVSRGISKSILDINRVTSTILPHIAQADYVVYGPVTVTGALAMVMLASIGKTFDEIANFLGLSSGLDIQNNSIMVQEQISRMFAKMETSTGIEIGQRVNFANAIFVQQDFPIHPDYQIASELLYQSNIVNLDFKGNPEMAQNVINAWVSGRTNSKISTLLAEPPPPNTRAIIASVLYFQAAWEFPFFDGGTQWRPFYVNGRKKPSDRNALMMSNGGEFPYYRDTSLGVEIMGFPYKGNRTTMFVIVPNDSNKEKLKKLENSLTPDDLEHLVSSTKYTEAVVLFPKMKLETNINLKPVLNQLGVSTMFNRREANFALLSSGIEQKFSVSEEAPYVSPPIAAPNTVQRPRPLPQQEEDRLIFTRFGDSDNCIPVLDPVTNTSKCHETPKSQPGSPVPLSLDEGGRALNTLSLLRKQLSQYPTLANPGLYADQVIHKVYIDITESGTEAAAATGVSLNRSGGRVTFRVDVPFLFFIYHEDTKVILFWGSVKSPSPSSPTRNST